MSTDSHEPKKNAEHIESPVPGDSEKGTNAGVEEITAFKHAERRLVRKLDMVLVPLTALLYLAAFLDRGNMGNARLQGLEEQVLGNNDTRFSVCLAVFYVAYIVCNIPGNISAKIFSPAHSLGVAALIWGVASTLQAVTFNYAGLIACRIFIGVGEAGFSAVVPLYYSMWYRRDEIGARISLFIGCGALAGTFGGLIAFGVSNIHSHIATWKILFLIEGLPTVILSFFIYFFLPGRPESSKFLTDDERIIAEKRLNSQGKSEGPNIFNKRGFVRAVSDYKNWMIAGMYLGVNLTLGSISGFLPTIIKSLGWTAARAQLFTVPPYAVALVVMFIVSFSSDKLRIRGLFVALMASISAIGFIILLATDPNANHHVRYFAVFLCVAPTFTNIPLCLSWVSNNNGSESSRSVALGMVNAVGQCFSILASFSFPSNEGPKYARGFGLNLAFSITTALLGLSLYILLKMENARRDKVEGRKEGGDDDAEGVDVIEQFDLAPGFRYIT